MTSVLLVFRRGRARGPRESGFLKDDNAVGVCPLQVVFDPPAVGGFCETLGVEINFTGADATHIPGFGHEVFHFYFPLLDFANFDCDVAAGSHDARAVSPV